MSKQQFFGTILPGQHASPNTKPIDFTGMVKIIPTVGQVFNVPQEGLIREGRYKVRQQHSLKMTVGNRNVSVPHRTIEYIGRQGAELPAIHLTVIDTPPPARVTPEAAVPELVLART